MAYIRALTVGAAFLLAGAMSAEAADTKTDTVAGWDIMKGAAGCYMQADYEGDSQVRMGLNKAETEGFLTILDPTWKQFQAGTAYKVDMDLDGQVWEGDAKGVKEGGRPGLIITFDHSDFFVDMMKKHALALAHGGKELSTISLDGTFKALSAVLECQGH